MSRQDHQYVVDERGEKIGVIISLEEYHRLKHEPKVELMKREIKFGRGHLGDIHGELSREDIYCDR